MREVSPDLCVRLKGELISFRFLETGDLEFLAPFFTCRQVERGEVLWQEGDVCDFVVFIIEGRVNIKKETEFKGKQVIVGVYGKGTIVGEICMLERTPRAVTAVALDDSYLLLLSRENLDRLLADNPAIGVKLLKGMLLTVSIRLRKSFDRLAAIF
jgi:CRP-like cAMP-binding protein